MERVTARTKDGKEEPATVIVPSFTEPGKTYEVTLSPHVTCQCKRFQFTGGCLKHVATAESLILARREHVAMYRRLAEARVLRLARAVYAPLSGSPIESYELALEVAGYRHAGERLRIAAWKRHHRVLLLDERSRRPRRAA